MHIEKEAAYLIKRKMQTAGYIDLPAEGTSMYPFIHPGDLCRFLLCEPYLLKRGDVVLYYSRGQRLVAHRFSHMNGDDFLFKGDTNLGFDEPVEEELILGRLTWVQSKKKKEAENFISIVWGKLILNFPILPELLRNRLNKKEE